MIKTITKEMLYLTAYPQRNRNMVSIHKYYKRYTRKQLISIIDRKYSKLNQKYNKEVKND